MPPSPQTPPPGDAPGGKAEFTSIYTEPDPRGYFATLRPLEYQIPQQALPAVEHVLEASQLGDDATILDVCCSYGINAALLRCELSFPELVDRYADPALAGVSTERVQADSRAFYASRLRHPGRRMLGLDKSAPAIAYAAAAGLHEDGWAEDLEADDPSAGLAARLGEVDLVLCTGGVGYIGQRTFSRILARHPSPDRVWVLCFVLRMFDYDPIAETLRSFGLQTEQLPGLSVRQRRFADDTERAAAISGVRARGLDPTGKEADGWYYADCFLSRPDRRTSAPEGKLSARVRS